MGPKLTMSSAPHEPIYGTRVRAIAPKRSSVAGNTPPSKQIADLGGGDVDDADHGAGIDEFFHRLAADAGGVENQTLEIVVERIDDGFDARRGHAEHGEADHRPVAAAPHRRAFALAARRPRLDHADHRRRAVGEDLAAYRIQPGNVCDRVEHHDVGRADIGRDIAGGDRRNQHLRHADRQRAHRRRDQRGAAGAARRDQAADRLVPLDPGFERLRHRGDRGTAVAGEHRIGAAAVIRGNVVRRHVGRRGSAGGRKIDQNDAHAGRGDLIPYEAQLRAFGIERAGDDHGRRSAAVDRPQVDRRGRGDRAGSGATVWVRAALSIWTTGTGCDQRVGTAGFDM